MKLKFNSHLKKSTGKESATSAQFKCNNFKKIVHIQLIDVFYFSCIYVRHIFLLKHALKSNSINKALLKAFDRKFIRVE